MLFGCEQLFVWGQSCTTAQNTGCGGDHKLTGTSTFLTTRLEDVDTETQDNVDKELEVDKIRANKLTNINLIVFYITLWKCERAGRRKLMKGCKMSLQRHTKMFNASVVCKALLAQVDNFDAPIVTFAGEKYFLQPELC